MADSFLKKQKGVSRKVIFIVLLTTKIIDDVKNQSIINIWLNVNLWKCRFRTKLEQEEKNNIMAVKIQFLFTSPRFYNFGNSFVVSIVPSTVIPLSVKVW